MSDQIGGRWSCGTSRGYVFDAPVVVPGTPFAILHIEDINELGSNGRQQCLEIFHDDLSMLQVGSDRHNEVRQSRGNDLKRKFRCQIEARQA